MTKKNKRYLIALSLLTFLIIFFSIPLLSVTSKKSSPSISLAIKALSEKETEYLTNFFKLCFFQSSFGYTIFGDKPMSFDTIDLLAPSPNMDDFDYMDIEHIFNKYRVKEGWEVWQKYASLFPLKGFSLIHYPCPTSPSEHIEIAIINHASFLKVVTQYLTDFQAVLEAKVLPQEILDGYLKGKGTIFNRIRNHDGLFGTLLGYGRQNSWEYRRLSGGETLKGFIEVDPRDTQHILPPLFKVLPHTLETKKLYENYEKQRYQIDLIYNRSDFLLIVLSQLTGTTP